MNRLNGGYQLIKLKENYNVSATETNITDDDLKQFSVFKDFNFKPVCITFNDNGETHVVNCSVSLSDDLVNIVLIGVDYNVLNGEFRDIIIELERADRTFDVISAKLKALPH